MTQELFNQLLANSPIVAVLVYYGQKIIQLTERLSMLEGYIYEHFRKGKK